MTEKKSRWGFLKTPTIQKNYEKLEVPQNYGTKFSNSESLDLDRNF